MDESTRENETQLVVFMLGEEEFACEINNVAEVLKMVKVTPLPQTIEFVEGVINLRGEVIPVIDLRKRFGLMEAERTSDSRIIIVEVDGRMFGLIVDSVSEVAGLPSNQIQEAPDHIAGGRNHLIMGVGKIDDRMVIILNIEHILSADEQVALDQVTQPEKEVPQKDQKNQV